MAQGGQQHIGASQCEYREFLNPEDGTDIWPETSVRNYPYSLRNATAEGISQSGVSTFCIVH